MQTRTIITAIIILAATKAFSQSKFRQGIIAANTITFKVDTLSGHFISIHNQSNPVDTVPPVKLVRLSVFKMVDTNAFFGAVKKVFKKARLTELLPEKFLVVTYYPNRNGRIKYLTFLLSKTTVITPQELELLEKDLKEKVIFMIPAGEDYSDNIWPVTQVIKFQTIFDKS